MPDWASLRAEFPLLDRYVYVGGLGTLASGLPLPPGRDKVLIGALDFPTIGHQWLSRPQFEVEFVPSDVDWRPGRVRLSPHWCVTEAELEHGTDLVLQHVAARK